MLIDILNSEMCNIEIDVIITSFMQILFYAFFNEFRILTFVLVFTHTHTDRQTDTHTHTLTCSIYTFV